MVATVVQQERRLDYIDVNLIRTSTQALREVNRNEPQYVELVQSVKNTGGILSPISVREMQDPETNESYFSLIDGLQRLTASKDNGFTKVPAQIMSTDDFNVMLDQVIGNTCRVETKPAEYSKHLQHIMQMCPTMTISDLAAKLAKSDTWLKERLNLTKLTVDAAKLVDSGAINLVNGYSLARLPVEEQADFIEQAQSLPTQEFTNVVVARNAAIRKAKAEGRTADEAPVFVHKPYLLKVGDVAKEMVSGAVRDKTILDQKLTSAEDGWDEALKWVSTSDDASVSAAKAKWEVLESVRLEKKAKATAERDRRKAAAASVKAARQKLELELHEKGADPVEIATELAKFDVAAKKAAEDAKAAAGPSADEATEE